MEVYALTMLLSRTQRTGPTAPEVIDRLALARSAALLGTAWGAYELTRRYVTEREQFGAPLIKIPAVSTTLAQMAVRIKFAQSALDRATTVCADDKTPALRRFGAASAARISHGHYGDSGGAELPPTTWRSGHHSRVRPASLHQQVVGIAGRR